MEPNYLLPFRGDFDISFSKILKFFPYIGRADGSERFLCKECKEGMSEKCNCVISSFRLHCAATGNYDRFSFFHTAQHQKHFGYTPVTFCIQITYGMTII